MPGYFADNVMVDKVVAEASRYRILVCALHLCDSRDPAGGLTVTNLTRIGARQGIAGRGRMLAVLGIRQLARNLRRRRSSTGARIVQLEPATEFMLVVEGCNQRILQIIDASNGA